MTALIDGKHPKIIIIDYYDDLISRLDIYAEETLENVKENEYVNVKVFENEEQNKEAIDNRYNSVKEQFKDPYSDEYTFDDAIESRKGVLLKDFVHLERMKAINEIKKIQKDRLEELKLSKMRPTSVEEALFGGNKFCFLINIEKCIKGKKTNFKMMTIIVDFYLDKANIELVE
jgi:hypothetical protein